MRTKLRTAPVLAAMLVGLVVAAVFGGAPASASPVGRGFLTARHMPFSLPGARGSGSPARGVVDPPGRYTYIPVAVPGYGNATVAYNVNELGDVTGWYFPLLPLPVFDGWVGYVEIGGKYTTIEPPGLPAGTDVGVLNVTPWGEIMGGYTTPDTISHGFVDVYGKFTTLDDPNADNTVPEGGTEPLGASMTGEIVGQYLDSSGVSGNVCRVDESA